MIAKLTEIHKHPHSVIGCVFKELGEIVSFVSLFFYKFRKKKKGSVWGEEREKDAEGKGKEISLTTLTKDKVEQKCITTGTEKRKRRNGSPDSGHMCGLEALTDME